MILLKLEVLTGRGCKEAENTLRNFVIECEQSQLQFSATKTKELKVDLRRAKAQVATVFIQGVSADNVEDYKYLALPTDWTGLRTLKPSRV